MIQLVLPTVRAQRAGRIINVSSIGGKIGEPFGAWYHATKFAVERLSDSLRMELHPFGVDVVVIEPGAIKTEWNGIARQGLLKVSGETAYRDGARAHVTMLASADEGTLPSPPPVVAEAIVRASLASRPKTRYPVGGGAGFVLLLRSCLGDRAFDAVMRMFSNRAQSSSSRAVKLTEQ